MENLDCCAKANCELFFETFCDKQVPIVIVITGLEGISDTDRWWVDNKAVFDQYKMSFSGVACITATKGKKRGEVYSYEAEYEESKWKVEDLIHRSHMREAWKKPTTPWFASMLGRMRNIFAKFLGLEPTVVAHALHYALRTSVACLTVRLG